MGDDSIDTEKRELWLFGRNVAEIPCFRNTFLYAISGGLGAGFCYFILTSNVRHASHAGVATYVGIGLVYWIRCRYDYAVSEFNSRLIRAAMKERIRSEGITNMDEIEDVKKT